MNHFFQETKIKKRRSFRDLVYNSLTRSKSKNNNNIYKAPDGGGVDASSRSCARADSTPAGCVEFDPLHAERDLDHFTPDSRRLIIIIAIQLSGGPAGARGRRRCPWTLCRRSSRPPPPGHPLIRRRRRSTSTRASSAAPGRRDRRTGFVRIRICNTKHKHLQYFMSFYFHSFYHLISGVSIKKKIVSF